MAVGCGRPALPSDVFSAGTGFGFNGEECPLTQGPLQNYSRKEVEPYVNSQMVQTLDKQLQVLRRVFSVGLGKQAVVFQSNQTERPDLSSFSTGFAAYSY